MGACFDDLEWRGLVSQTTDPELGKALDEDALTFYIGFDPTADSLHVGHLLQLCNLRRLQEAGHRPIALAGGGTGMIGDPGGKSEERNLLTREQLEANLAGIRSQLERFVDFSAGAILVDNGDWLWQVGLLEFLRDIGKHFTVNQMVAKESVRSRFETRDQGISFTEFSYMLLQAYDFHQLYRRHGCRLQLGGSDQWGNITMGVELVRKLEGDRVFGMTSPLVLKADGTKFGKSEAGTVWLDRDRTSPYQLWQFLLQSEDAVVGTYLRYFTWLSHDRIEELERATAEHPERREAQRALASNVVALVHGEDEARGAERAAAVLFSEEVASLDERTLLDVLADAPSSIRHREELDGSGLDVVDALVSSGLVSSKSEARKALAQGGVYLNNRKLPEEDARIRADDLLHGRLALLRRGKRTQHLLRFEG